MMHRRLVTSQLRPIDWMIGALPWLSSRELELLAQAVIDCLDDFDGNSDLESDEDVEADDLGEEE